MTAFKSCQPVYALECNGMLFRFQHMRYVFEMCSIHQFTNRHTIDVFLSFYISCQLKLLVMESPYPGCGWLCPPRSCISAMATNRQAESADSDWGLSKRDAPIAFGCIVNSSMRLNYRNKPSIHTTRHTHTRVIPAVLCDAYQHSIDMSVVDGFDSNWPFDPDYISKQTLIPACNVVRTYICFLANCSVYSTHTRFIFNCHVLLAMHTQTASFAFTMFSVNLHLLQMALGQRTTTNLVGRPVIG